MKYGKAIRFVRAARGIPQKELASKIKADASLISRIEAGERNPSTETLEAISVALEVPLYLLVLLASEERELRGVPKGTAEKLGKELFSLVLSAQKEFA
jgi:transcriptional regulator with XRE-family HTH domain